MIARPDQLPMSVEDYLELDRNSMEARYEFVDGIVTMLTGGTTNHSLIGANFSSLLRTSLRGKQCRVYNSDLRVRVSEVHYFSPDISVSCDPRDRELRDCISYPSLIIEVLSPKTEAYDRGKKFAYYRICPILQEYVLVSTQEQAIDVYRRAKDKFWTFHPFDSGHEVELKSITEKYQCKISYLRCL